MRASLQTDRGCTWSDLEVGDVDDEQERWTCWFDLVCWRMH